FAKYLSKYGDWELSSQGGSLLIPKERFHFDSILFLPKRLSYSADRTWKFIASVPIIIRSDFLPENIILFQMLKGVECELIRSGFLKKQYQFKTNSLLLSLQEEIPSLKINNLLMENLNQDVDLIKLISVISPESMDFQLFSPHIEANDLNDYRVKFKGLFNNPEEIIWNIIIEKYLDTIITRKKYTVILDSLIQALEESSIHVTRVTNIFKRRL
ncbi:MAG: hypothetical protein ACFFAU_10155, partial [Candidatus Hodarchaeota archaeon]